MMLNLQRRQLAQADVSLSIVEIMDRLGNTHEVTLLYPAPRGSNEPLVRTVLSETELIQPRHLCRRCPRTLPTRVGHTLCHRGRPRQ